MCGFHGELELRQATSWNVARGVQKGWKSVLELALPRNRIGCHPAGVQELCHRETRTARGGCPPVALQFYASTRSRRSLILHLNPQLNKKNPCAGQT
jgi:hypothetical protein